MATTTSLTKAKAIPFREDDTDVVLKDGEDASYLEKGERIESLARVQFMRVGVGGLRGKGVKVITFLYQMCLFFCASNP